MNELYWAAGFLEGEGYFGTPTQNGLVVSASQKEIEPLERLQRLFGGTISIKAVRPPYQDINDWRVYGSKAAQVMLTLWTLLSKKRRLQIEKSIENWKPRQTRRWAKKPTDA